MTKSGDTLVHVETRDAVSFLTLDDPVSLNALSELMIDQLIAALRDAQRISRAVVVTGRGKSFCSGAHLSPDRVDPALPDYDAGKALDRHFNPLIQCVRHLDLPVIAAVNGVAAGFGASLAFACDIIIASKSAYFLEAFRHIALVPDGGASHALVRTIGRVRANEMMMLGNRVTATQAQIWGLINRTVTDDTLESASFELAKELANGPTVTLGLIKRLSWSAADDPFDGVMALERRLQRTAGKTDDHQEGVSAFREKRQARFVGT